MTTERKRHVELAEVIEIPLRDFLEMKPAPGHRNSEARAQKADHLRHLVPEHLEVEVAEYRDASGLLQRVRMTGNTRAQVWKCGLSDNLPEKVRARLYRMENEDEVRQRMLLHDSPEAAWSSTDYVHRALDMTFGDNWRPRSKALSGGRFNRAIRVADSLVNHSRWSPDTSAKVETILPHWRKQFMALDDIVDHPLADAIRDKKPFTWGFLCGLLILLQFKDRDIVADFARGVFTDRGDKSDDGYDGIRALIENLGKGKGVNTESHQQKMIMCVIGGFEQWEHGLRSPAAPSKIRKCEPLDWIRRARERVHQKPSTIEAAE